MMDHVDQYTGFLRLPESLHSMLLRLLGFKKGRVTLLRTGSAAQPLLSICTSLPISKPTAKALP